MASGLLSAGVGVMLLKDGMVLLGKRNDDPGKAGSLLDGQGTWTLPGGKMEFGESFEHAACREVAEETGIRVSPEDMRLMSVSNEIASRAQFVCLGLLAERFEGQVQTMERDEITEWRWFPLTALPTPLFPASRHMIENYLAGKFYSARA